MEKLSKMNDCGRLLLNIPSGKFPRKHSWWHHLVYNRYPEQWVCNLTKKGLYHQEIFENGCLLTSSYATRNVDCIPLIKIKHNFFKNNFFPSVIIEWSKLDPAIRNAESLGIFKISILKFLDPPQEVFSIVTTTKELD